MFQTKVNPEYMAQIEAKDFQVQCLEEELKEVREKIENFNGVSVSAQEDLEPMLRAAGEVVDHLRTDILEPVHYQKLHEVVTGFLMTSVTQQFKAVSGSEGNAKKALTTTVDLYKLSMACQHVVPRLYLMATAAAVYFSQLSRYRAKLWENADYGAVLRKRGAPSSFSKIRGAKGAILV